MSNNNVLKTNKKKGETLRYIKKKKYLYMLLIPAAICTLIFNYLPMIGIGIAFKDYNVIDGIIGSPWVGLDNFKTIIEMPSVLHALKNTFKYGFIFMFGGTPFAVVFALMINEIRNIHFKKFVQTISYLPHFLSWASVVAIFYGFFSLSGPYNEIMAKIIGDEYEATNLLMNYKNFTPVLFASNVWKGLGWSSILYLAAIAGIDQEMYEAAEIDGCGKFKQAIYITLPCIAVTIAMSMLLSVGSLISVNFEQVYGFQNVYIQEQTDTINTLAYRMGIEGGEYSLSTAFGLLQGLASLTIMLIVNELSRRFAHMSVW